MIQGKVSGRIKHLKRAIARRKVYPGYPVLPRKFTGAEVRDYLGGQKIVCLLCGHSFRRIGASHLPMIHGVTEDDYREMYGLPYRVGLASASCRDAYRKATVARIDSDGGQLAGHLKRGREEFAPRRAVHMRKQRKPRYAVAEAKERFAALNRSMGCGKWTDKDAEAILEEITLGRREKDVLADAGRPTASWWFHYLSDHHEFKARREAALDAQPFSVQARGTSKGIGPRFDAEVRKLFDEGLSDHKIAAALGVTAMTSNRRTKVWRQQKSAHG